MKKAGKILMVLLLLLAIAGGALAYTYFYTDIFKSNKEMFFTYIVQNAEISEFFNEEALTNYNNKLKNTPYTENVKFTVENTENEELDSLSIDIDGKSDATKKQYEYNLNLNYSEEVSMPFTFKMEEDVIGITSEEIVSQFIGIRNKDLDEFLKKFGIENENIPSEISEDTIAFEKYLLTENDKLNGAYEEIITNSFMEENFSKNKVDGYTVYSLNTSTKDLKNLYIKMFEAAKNENVVIEKVIAIMKDLAQEEVTLEDIQKMIDEMINELKSEELAEEDIREIKINLYVSDKKLAKTELIVENTSVILEKGNNKYEITIVNNLSNEIATIILEKIKENDKIKYVFSLNSSDNGLVIGNMQIAYDITGVETLNNVAINTTYSVETLDPSTEEYEAYDDLKSDQKMYESYMQMAEENSKLPEDERSNLDYAAFAEGYKVDENELTAARDALKQVELMKVSYNLSSTIAFDESLVIEPINENNIVILNDYDVNVISSVLMQVGNQFVTVHSNKMNELGYEEDPFLQLIPGYSILKLYMSMSSLENDTTIPSIGGAYSDSDYDSDYEYDYEDSYNTSYDEEYPTITGVSNSL